MSHVQLLLNMVSAHKDDLELWAVDEIKTGTVARITKLASDAYIQQHNKQQEAEKKKVLGVSAAERTLQLNDPTLHSCSLCGIIIPCFSRLSGLVRHTETFHPEKREFISSLKMALKEQQEETKRLKAKKRSAKRQLR